MGNLTNKIKIKAFDLNRLTFATVGLCETAKTVSWQKILKYRLLGLMLCVTFVASISSSSKFIQENLASDLLNSAFALFQVAASASVLFPMLGAFFYRDKIGRLFSKINQIQGGCDSNSKTSS